MKKRTLALAMAVFMICVVLAGCKSDGNVVSQTRSGVVRVMARYIEEVYQANPDTGRYEYVTSYWRTATGSAFGVGSAGKQTDIFITNRHVVENSYTEYEDGNTYYDEYKYVGTLDSVYILKDDYAYSANGGIDTSRAVPCDVIYCGGESDPDLAVLQAAEKVDGRIALPLLAEGDDVEAGDVVYAFGFPGSTDATNTTTAASVERVTVTNGIVSLHSYVSGSSGTRTRIIQHTAQINHGNSGGPLVNENGAVAGVNTWGWGQNDTTGDSGSYGSIEIEYVREILDDLHIHYDVYKSGHTGLLVLLIVVVIALIAAAVFIAARRKRTPVFTAPVVQSPMVVTPAAKSPAAVDAAPRPGSDTAVTGEHGNPSGDTENP